MEQQATAGFLSNKSPKLSERGSLASVLAAVKTMVFINSFGEVKSNDFVLQNTVFIAFSCTILNRIWRKRSFTIA